MWRAMADAGDEGGEGSARAEPVASTPAPPEAPPGAAAEWTCAICTYINKSAAHACEMCQTANPEPAPKRSSSRVGGALGAVVGQAEEARADAVKLMDGDHAPPSGALYTAGVEGEQGFNKTVTDVKFRSK